METVEDISINFRELIRDNDIIVFSKTTCPFCRKVKKLFADLNKTIEVFELNTYPDETCSLMQDALKEMSGMRTVPNVYIRQHHVGGCSDTELALADGSLFEMFDGTYKKRDYDYIVIGGGSGGLASSQEAASYGRRVACCDFVVPSPIGTTWGLGGTCVNVGCIPKKLMHKASIVGEDIRDSAHLGWSTEAKEYVNNQAMGDTEKSHFQHSWYDMVENIQNYIRSLNFKYKRNLKDGNVTYYNALATFQDSHTLLLTPSDGEQITITGQNILLATGCRPKYPDFKGAKEHCITSDDIFSLKEPPGKTLIVGASYIALETAGFLAGLGFDVTVMVRSILLRGFDQEIANKIGENMKTHNVKFLNNCVPHSVIRQDERKLLVTVRNSVENTEFRETFNTVLLAVGREACIQNMGLEEIGVTCENGKVKVDEKNQTTVANVYAVGDIIEEHLQLTPVAIQEGKLLAQRLYGKQSMLMDYLYVPTTVFTPLEYGCVGYSEEKAIAVFEGPNIEVYHIHFQPLEWELSKRNSNESFSKLICLKNENERVVGFHYLGPNAGEVTQGFALALKLGATKNDFNNLIGIHPTCAEIFTTMTITKASGKPAKSKGC